MSKEDATQAPEPQRKPGTPGRAEGVPAPLSATEARAARASRSRRAVRVLLVALGFFTALVVVVTQSGMLRLLVIPQIESVLGATIQAGRTTIDRGGELVIADPELRNDRQGLADAAAQFLKADELRVRLDWGALLRGRLDLERVVLVRPVIRVSQDKSLELNIKEVVEHLAKGGARGSMITRLPEVRVYGASIEFGEHQAGPPATYTELTSVRVSGTVRADPASPSRYVVDFSEERPDGPGVSVSSNPLLGAKRPGLGSALTSPKMKVGGWLEMNPASADLTLTNVDLNELGRRQAPTWFNDVWGDLRLAGEIPTIQFGYDGTRGLRMSFDVVGLTMNIPIPVEPDLDAKGDPVPGARGERRLMAMRDVTGRISLSGVAVEAELNGSIEDFPLTVRLRSEGREINSALSCDLESRGFLVSKRPMLLPFAPPFVRLLFQRLGGPTMEAEGVVKLRREAALPDGSTGPIRVAGTLKFKNGSAAHELFAYPISQLSGVVEFDDSKVELLNIKGSNPNGAKLLASGVISPPNETAAAKVDVTVVDIPVDGLFREALPAERRAVFDALLDNSAYDAFRAEGLLQSTDDRAAREKRLADLRTNIAMGDRFGGGAVRMAEMQAEAERVQEELKIPLFDLGGLAQMEIAVTREPGAETETKADVHFTASRMGLMLKAFPLPLVARNLDMQLGGDSTTFKPVAVSVPTGGTGVVSGRVDYPDGGGLQPRVDIRADGVALSPVFVRALPNPDRAVVNVGRYPGRATARELVGGFGLSGNMDAFAIVRPDPNDPESASFRVDVSVSGMTARPGDGSEELTNLHGGVSVSDGAVEVPYMAGLIDDVPFDLSAHVWFGGDEPEALFGVARSGSLNLSGFIENFVAPGAPEAAARIAQLRRERLPQGCASGEVVVADSGSGTAALIKLEGMEGGSFQAPGGRFGINSARGLVGVTADAVTFGEVQLTAPNGTEAFLDGALALGDGLETELLLRAKSARFESPLVRSLASLSGPEVERFIEDAQPVGAFDAEVFHRRNHGVPGARESRGWIEPRSISLTRRGVRIELPEASGRFSFDPSGGRFDALTARAATWSARADGSYTISPAVSVDLALDMEGDAIAPDLRAALPLAVAEAMESVELGEKGRFAMRDAAVKFSAAEGTRFRGSVDLSGVTLKPVVSISDADGRVDVVAGPADAAGVKGSSGGGTKVAIDVAAKSFTLAGVCMTGGTAKVLADASSGALEVQRFGAVCHGGRVSAQGSLAGAGANRGFEFAADISNVRFGDLLADLYPKSALDESGKSDAPNAVDRGYLDGSFSVAGLLGKASSRRGRGLLRVQDGEVLNMPAVVPILRLSNLQAPVNERVGFGYAAFYVQGEKLRFDEFTLQSKSLAIDGRGTVTWPDLGVDMRFVTRSLDRIPLLTDLLEGVRDELVTTTVSGTLYSPQLEYEQLSATRQMLDQMFSKKKRDVRPEASLDQPARQPEQ